ncbi:MAG: VOC family protein [Bifidobacteriaceae bacterium]|jgi:predicted enzyme related to lactoylglutathione lyase|nr:VOC family protein [Bifidobacteriaceae bacterium]
MSAQIGMVSFDCDDARALAAWWAERTGGQIVQDMDGFFLIVAPAGGGVSLGFQKVADRTPGKNRLHLDLHAPDRPAAVREFLDAGATLVAEQAMPDFAWTVLADPEGNQFCICNE